MSMYPGATSVCDSKDGASVLVATRGGEIFEFNQQSGNASLYLRGHFNEELWGLAVHPKEAQVYTWGRDAMLAVWDLKSRRQLKHCKLESGGDAIAFSNNGKYLVLGFINGTMLALDDNFSALSKRRDRERGQAIQCLKFSPDDTVLAAGGHD
jgi:microtubule-associated protein-like 6